MRQHVLNKRSLLLLLLLLILLLLLLLLLLLPFGSYPNNETLRVDRTLKVFPLRCFDTVFLGPYLTF